VILRVATYNVHGCVGIDRRFDAGRIARVIGAIDADVVALQEVVTPVRGVDVHAVLAASGDYRIATRATMQLAGGTFGNAVLSRWPIVDERSHDLSVAKREPRAAIDVTVDVGGRAVRVIATHLGLGASERRMQLARIVEIADSSDRLTIVAGDFNVIRASGRALRDVFAHFGMTVSPRTFPSIAPMLALDRIGVRGASVTTLDAHRDRLARVASDHLPLVAEIEV
jgi:endonuclease/exonuclease/phosphatase family metal-dependent hydrolase